VGCHLPAAFRVKLSVVVIETERLLLRPVRIDDLDELVALHAEPDVEHFMGRFSRARMIEWIRSVEEDWATYGYGRAAILERD
jgi:RimJ/RimL family protein N-acetyltransferase